LRHPGIDLNVRLCYRLIKNSSLFYLFIKIRETWGILWNVTPSRSDFLAEWKCLFLLAAACQRKYRCVQKSWMHML
jgi:hypothetical protein